MRCHGFKGGIGTASRVLAAEDGGWTVGALVQANYGQRALLRVDGVPVRQEISVEDAPVAEMPTPSSPQEPGAGSIIVLLATDAPLLPLQCRRLAQRATLGIARMGGLGANSSGDLFLAFATGNRGLDGARAERGILDVRTLTNGAMTPIFEAAAEATEEAILNALCMATTMTGIAGRTTHALPLDRLVEIMRKYGRLNDGQHASRQP
jgi:D-aminopeptidase